MADNEDDVQAAPPVKPKKWYQWVLMYPAVILAMIGAIPTATELIKSFKLDVDWGTTKIVEEQHKMWKENFDCTQKKTATIIKNEFGATISVIICDSGDILLSGQKPGDKNPGFRWVPWESTLTTEVANGFSLVTEVIADTNVHSTNIVNEQRILCQRWLDQRHFVRRVMYSNGCYDEVIDVYLGRIVQATPAPCTCQ